MILERLFGTTLEDPRFSLQDQAAVDIFGGPPNDSGVRVNSSTANTYSPWFRGINLISRDCGKLPLHIYKRIAADGAEESGDGDIIQGKSRFVDHPSYQILRRKTNVAQTALQFKMLLTSHALSLGNGYGYIIRAGDGTVLPVNEGGGIIPMDPSLTYPVKETTSNDLTGEVIGNRLWYVTHVNSKERKIPAEDVLHIKGMGYDGLAGYSVVSLAANTIGRGMAHQKFANKFFSNGMHLKVVLETDKGITPEAARKITDNWNTMQAGIENSHRTAILYNGLKANNLTGSARDAQFIEGEEFTIRFIANFLGIPAHKLGAKTGESYASKEIEQLAYLQEALDFWLCVWEDECWDKLLREDEKYGDLIHVEFSREKLFETDLNTKATYWRTALAGQAWAKVNEARSSFNMNPVEGGDEVLTPLNMGQGGPANEPVPPQAPTKKKVPPPEDTTDQGALRAAIKANLEDSVRRVVRRIGHDATKAAMKPISFCDWLDKVPGDHGKIIGEMLRPSLDAASAIEGERVNAEPNCVIRDVCAALLEFSGKVTPKTMAAELPKEMARLESEIPAKVSAIFFGV